MMGISVISDLVYNKSNKKRTEGLFFLNSKKGGLIESSTEIH